MDVSLSVVFAIMMLCVGFIVGILFSIVPKVIAKMKAGVSGLQTAKCIFLTTGYKVITKMLPIQAVGSKKAVFFRHGMYLMDDDSCFYSSSVPTSIYREGNPVPVVTRSGGRTEIPSSELYSAVRSKVVEELNAASQSRQIIQAMFFSLIAMACSVVSVILIYLVMMRVNVLIKIIYEMSKVATTS